MKEKEELIAIGKVFPSEETSIYVLKDDTYNGAHEYTFNNSLGHVDGKPVYTQNTQTIKFVKKENDTMVEGIQSEQLLIALIDRHIKLNNAFPSTDGELAIEYMKKTLDCLENRVRERIARGVMGQLKK